MKAAHLSAIATLATANALGGVACTAGEDPPPPVVQAVTDEQVEPQQRVYEWCAGDCTICHAYDAPSGGSAGCAYDPACCQGRPLVIDGKPRVASLEARDDWA